MNYVVIENSSSQVQQDLKSGGNVYKNSEARERYQDIEGYIAYYKNVELDSYESYKDWTEGTLYTFPRDNRLFLAINTYDKGLNETTPDDAWREENIKIFSSSKDVLNLIKDKEDYKNKTSEISEKSDNDKTQYPNIELLKKVKKELEEKLNTQSDYNQNDKKQIDYIKNRPFYEVFVSEDWLKDRAFKYPPEGSEDVAWFYYREDMNSVYGHGWTLPFIAHLDITINGVTETHDVTITNTYDSVDITSHEYPVSISPIADIGDGLLTGFALVCLANGVSGTATLSWLEMKQIDEKFIPNTIARIEDVNKNFIEICAPERSQNLPFKQIESSDDVVRFVLRDDIDGSVIETEKYRPLSYGLTGYINITINGVTERKKIEFYTEDSIIVVSQGYPFQVGVSCYYGTGEPLIYDVFLVCAENITGTASFSYEKEKVFNELHIPDTIARTKDVDKKIGELKQGLKLESPNGTMYLLKVADDGVLTTELCLPDGVVGIGIGDTISMYDTIVGYEYNGYKTTFEEGRGLGIVLSSGEAQAMLALPSYMPYNENTIAKIAYISINDASGESDIDLEKIYVIRGEAN